MAKPARETFVCPNCGADVPVSAATCPECGSDEETGWSEDTIYDGLDLPTPGDGEEEPATDPRGSVPTIVVVLAIIVVLLFVLVRIW